MNPTNTNVGDGGQGDGGGRSLLAILLVTHTEQSSPALSFAWPPSPQPTPRLSQPVYRHDQVWADVENRSFVTGTQGNPQPTKVKDATSDHPTLQFLRNYEGLVADPDDLSSEGILEATALPAPSMRRSSAPHNPQKHSARPKLGHPPRMSSAPQESLERDENQGIIFPGSFYLAKPGNLGPHKPPRTQNLSGLSSYLGFEPDEWADMLTPRLHSKLSESTDGRTASGKKLELTIDSLAIISHPVVISQKPTTSNVDLERGRTRTRSGEKNAMGSEQSVVGEGSLTRSPQISIVGDHSLSSISTVEEPTLTAIDAGVSTGIERLAVADPRPVVLSPSPSKPTNVPPVSQLTRMMTPSAIAPPEQPLNQFFVNIRDNPSVRSRSSPSPVPSQDRRHSTLELGSRSNIFHPSNYCPMTLPGQNNPVSSITSPVNPAHAPAGHLIPLQSFSLALIIDTPPACHISQHLEVYYRDVVLKLTAALKRLERQNSYLSREVHQISRIQVEQREFDMNRSSSQNRMTGVDGMMELIEENSDLARALARAFEDLKKLGCTSITLDHQLDLELLLHPEFFDFEPTNEPRVTNNGMRLLSLKLGEHSEFEHLGTWKSLLLLEDRQVLVDQTPPQSLLRKFIKLIQPTLRLSEYKFLLDTDSNTIAEMIEHLLYWKKAKVTDKITLENSYQLTLPPGPIDTTGYPTQTTIPIGDLRKEFATAFPNLPHLVSILSLISKRPRQPFSSILPILDPTLGKSQSMPVLVWLLKRELVCRERTHVRIKIDVHTKLKVLRRERRKAEDETASDQEFQNDTGYISLDSHPRAQSVLQDGGEPTKSQPLPLSGSRLESTRQEVRAGSSSSLRIEASLTSPDPETQSFAIISQSAQQQQFMVGSNSPIITRSVSDRSSCQLSLRQQQRNIEPGSADSIASSHELRRRQRRKLWQRFTQSGFLNLSDENIEEESDEGRRGDDFESCEEEIIGEPGQATALERAWLSVLCEDKTEDQINSFNLSHRYFNGRYPLEEICSRSGLTRIAINDVLNAFESNLILLIHP